MKRPPLEILRLRGSPADVAFELGKRRSAKIAVRVDHWNRYLDGRFKGKKDRLKSLVKEFLRTARAAAPRYVEEIHALAEGARLPFDDLFRLNLTELKPFAEKCSTVIFPIATPKGRRILIGHNEDWEPRQNDVFVLNVKLPDVTYTILTYDGYIPGLSSGLNSHGLCHAVNYVLAKDIRPAIPRGFITRFLVTARNAEECLDWIRKNKRAFGQSIHLAEKNRYTGIEVTAKRMAVRKLTLPTFHTNHYLEHSLRKYAALPSANSFTRHQVGEGLLEQICRKHGKKDFARKQAVQATLRILSDRSGLPYAIWRDDDQPEESSATVATALFGTDSDVMSVYRKKPDVSVPVRVKLK